MPAEKEALVPQVVSQLQDALDGALRPIENGVLRCVRIAVAEKLHGDNREVISQAVEVDFERGPTGRKTVDQEEGRGAFRVTVQFVPDPLTWRSE
jgi:hypothetical protein